MQWGLASRSSTGQRMEMFFTARIVVFPFLLFSGMTSVAFGNSSVVETKLAIHSALDRAGYSCVKSVRLFSLATSHETATALPFDGEMKQSDDETETLSLATAESFAYGQSLVGHYDRMLEQGLSFEQISRSPVYARLQSLSFIRAELRSRLSAKFLSRIAVVLRDGRGPNGLAEAITGFLSTVRSHIDRQIGDPRYATLATAEIDEDLSEVILLLQPGACVRSAEFLPTALAASWTHEVVSAAKSLPADLEAYRRFQPADRKKSIADFVNRAASSVDSASVELEPHRSVDLSSWGTAVYPSSGKNGNITGSNFPPRTWALTFDDGPARSTNTVLENLARHGMKATFFVLSKNLTSPALADIARRELSEGHAVESHSYSHPVTPKLGAASREKEIGGAAKKLAAVVGVAPRFFRLPYGSGVSNRAIRTLIADAGMVHVFWSVDTLDWQDKNPDSIVRRSLKQMTPGNGIILFHDIHPQSVIASEKLMEYLKNPANQLETGTIPEIVDGMNAKD